MCAQRMASEMVHMFVWHCVLQFEGTPFYPDASRYWQVVDKYAVSKFYTAPTAIRALMKFGESYVAKYVSLIL